MTTHPNPGDDVNAFKTCLGIIVAIACIPLVFALTTGIASWLQLTMTVS